MMTRQALSCLPLFCPYKIEKSVCGGSDKEEAEPAASGAGQRGAEQQPAEFFFGILPSEALIESTAPKSKLVTHGDL